MFIIYIVDCKYRPVLGPLWVFYIELRTVYVCNASKKNSIIFSLLLSTWSFWIPINFSSVSTGYIQLLSESQVASPSLRRRTPRCPSLNIPPQEPQPNSSRPVSLARPNGSYSPPLPLWLLSGRDLSSPLHELPPRRSPARSINDQLGIVVSFGGGC